MSFFDELTAKAKNVANVASNKARGAADSAKISADIVKERRVLDKNYRAIGQWFVAEYSDDAPEAIADLVAAVHASRSKIKELQDMRASAEDQPRPKRQTACPVCGEATSSKYCPHCGAPVNR